MSGLEVVGVVLGSIPLIVSALEHYKEGLHAISKWRKYSRELGSLIRSLQMQQSMLTNVCEKLLDDIVPGSNVDAMIKEPFGPLWKEESIECGLKFRLQRDMGLFEATVNDMLGAIEEVKKKLDLGPDGQVKWIQGGSFRKELGRASFTFKRNQYDELLNILKEGNSHLEILTKQNVDLEPKRRVRFHDRFMALLRTVSRNVHNAIRCSMSCSCATDHRMGLQLSAPKPTRGFQEDDEDVVANFSFHIALSLLPGKGKGTNDDGLWDQFVVRVASAREQHPPVVLPLGTVSKPPKKSKFVSFSYAASTRPSSNVLQVQPTTITQTRSVSDYSLPFPAQANVIVDPVLVTRKTNMPPPDLADICSTIRKNRLKYPDCYGYVTDFTSSQFSKFGVYQPPPPNDCGTGTGVSLHDILLGEAAEASIPYTHRVRLAYIISHSILQLFKTPWLSEVPTSKDIMFVRRQDSSICFDQVFITSNQDSNGTLYLGNPDTGHPAVVVRNHTTMALGILLIELMLQKPFDQLRKGPDHIGTLPSPYLDIKAARALADLVGLKCGSGFGSAIRRCVDCDFNSDWLTLDDEKFRQEFYSGVVALLESNLKRMQVSMV